MKKQPEHTGIAIAIAWPQTYCKQPGAWYDPLTLLLGINRNNYYKVGHAALVLIEKKAKKAHYFDFGRYHAPYRHGRVRSAETDHDLEIKTLPEFNEDGQKLENFRDIIYELQTNPACHGEGELYASYCHVDFEKAYAKSLWMLEAGPIPYGPFRYQGSNCSRFVNSVILAGNPDFRYRFNLKYRVPLTPTPINNVKALDNLYVLPKLLKGEPFCPIRKMDRQLLTATLPPPERHYLIPGNAQWLSGEGAGSWFVFNFEGTLLQVTRFSPQGVVECKGLFENPDAIESLKKTDSFFISYPSHCKMISVKVNDSEIRFKRAV